MPRDVNKARREPSPDRDPTPPRTALLGQLSESDVDRLGHLRSTQRDHKSHIEAGPEVHGRLLHALVEHPAQSGAHGPQKGFVCLRELEPADRDAPGLGDVLLGSMGIVEDNRARIADLG